MTRGLLQIPKQLPTTARDWEQFVARLNDKIRYDGERVVMDTLTTIASRSGTDLDTLLSYLTDTGRANSQTFLPQVQTGGVSSRQDAGPVTALTDQAYSAAWGDFDGDGRPDLYLSTLFNTPTALFRNTESGFVRVTDEPAMDAPGSRAGAARGGKGLRISTT